MKVVLKARVEGLGDPGEVKEVADGYARNYLLPRGLAIPASKAALAAIEARKAAAARRQAAELRQHQALAQRLNSLSVVVRQRVGESGRLYGSVTSADIAEALSQELGQQFDKRKIELEEPIRQLGTFTVPVRVAPHLNATLTVVVVPEG